MYTKNQFVYKVLALMFSGGMDYNIIQSNLVFTN